MKVRPSLNNCRTMALSLIAIVGLSSAFLPGQALARKHKGKAHAAAKAKADPWQESAKIAEKAPKARPAKVRVKAARSPMAASKPAVKTKVKAPRLTRGEQHDANKICVESFNKAKERRESGHLLEGKEFLSKCARKTCSEFLQQECTTLYTQLESDIPSVVPVVTDDTGAAHALVEVRMDGELLTSKLDGLALPVDPGKHVFSFSTEGGVFATLKTMVVQGQRNRPITALLHSRNKAGGAGAQPAASEVATNTSEAATTNAAVAEATSEPEGAGSTDSEDATSSRSTGHRATAKEAEGTPWLAYALGGVGVVGLGSAGLFTLWGRKDNTTLMNECAPFCNPDSAHHIRNLYLAADISLGVGVVALAASTWLLVRSHGTEEKASRSHISLLDVRPTPSGALATVGGTF